MIEHLLDTYAQNNAISQVNPVTKILLGVGSLIFILFSPHIIIPLYSATFLSLVIIYVAKIPPYGYLRLLSIPVGFTIMGVIPILLLTPGGEIIWRMALIPGVYLTITGTGVTTCLLILARVLGGTVALLFISLTTPFTDIIGVLTRCRVPQEITDLMTILYRNIFILLDQATQIHAAQVMRLGYSRPKEATESFGMLCGSLFISSWNAGNDLIKAMDSRCYDGKVASLSPCDPITTGSMALVLLYLFSLSCVWTVCFLSSQGVI